MLRLAGNLDENLDRIRPPPPHPPWDWKQVGLEELVVVEVGEGIPQLVVLASKDCNIGLNNGKGGGFW